jgi:hypothetical protein
MNAKVKGLDFSGRRYCGVLVRIDKTVAVVYCGGYESKVVPLADMIYL